MHEDNLLIYDVWGRFDSVNDWWETVKARKINYFSSTFVLLRGK